MGINNNIQQPPYLIPGIPSGMGNSKVVTTDSSGNIQATALSASAATALGNATNGASGIVALDANQNETIAGTLVQGSTFLRNKLINGSMNIDQRNNGASKTITAAAALAYTIDRWYAYCTGANVTGQRVANAGTTASPSQYAYQFTGAASVTAIGFAQRIEAANSYDLANTTATLAVNLANSVLTTVTWTAYYANTADTFGTLASPTKTQIATGTFTVNSTLTRYTTNITIPAAATTGIEILFTVGAQTSGTWIIGNAQLEAGSIATPFERVTYPAQLNYCQRYYYDAATGNSTMIAGANSWNTAQVSLGINFPEQMRTTPAINAASGTSYWRYDINGANTLFSGSFSLFNATKYSTLIFNNSLTGLTGGQAGAVMSNNAACFLGFDAEM